LPGQPHLGRSWTGADYPQDAYLLIRVSIVKYHISLIPYMLFSNTLKKLPKW